MARSLVTFESPANAKTINKYFGRDSTVKTSIGHPLHSPKITISILLPVDHKEEPNKPEATNTAKKVEIRGVDPGKIFRVTFNEITPRAIRAAFERPRQVDANLVDHQQPRRLLDRLVGYKISPLLWDKVRRGLSAGRVQTVALRLIVDREREIRAFIKREYWTIDAQLNAKKPPVLTARFTKKDDQSIEVADEATAKELVDQIEGSKYLVHSVTTREKKRNPVPPFITSTLQQESSRKLRFSIQRAMMLAQRLYEGVELGSEGSVGLISYMRTDSTRVSNDALDDVRGLIKDRFGPQFCPESPNVYKSKKDAQDAHEAIRPSSARRTPEDVAQYLQEDELKLYKLIWMRFVASQMPPAGFHH